MSNEDFSYKRFYKIPNEKGTEVKKNINFQLSGFNDENNFNEKMDTKIGQNENNYLNESNFNQHIFRECFNYFLSYFLEQDFAIEEKDEPKNAGFLARLFGNHPKIFPLLPELKSERNFIIFLKQNTLSTDEDMFKKIFGKILDFFNNSISNEIEEDKIYKKFNPLNLLSKSNLILKEKMKSYNMIKSSKKIFFEEYKINSIPILMLLQTLYIIEKYPNFLEFFINKFFSHEKEIILALSFYLSSISFDRLLSGRLNVFFDRTKLVLDTYEEFYLGLFSLIFDLFEEYNGNYHKIFYELESEAVNMPSSVLWKCKLFKLKYQEIGIDSSLSSYFNNSINPK
jgi:hypothetical protein